MQLYLYKTKDDNNKVNKTLTDSISISDIQKDSYDTQNPTITVQTSADITLYNYARIVDFGRYYFVTSVNRINETLYELSLAVDVLMTYKEQIRNLRAIIDKTKSEAFSDKYIDDGSYIAENRSYIISRSFPTGFSNTPQYILITAGGN